MNPMLTLDSSSLPPHHPPPHTSTPNLHAKPATARHAEFISASQHRTTHSPPRRIRHAELVSASQPNTQPRKSSWIKSRMTTATKTALHFPQLHIDHTTPHLYPNPPLRVMLDLFQHPNIVRHILRLTISVMLNLFQHPSIVRHILRLTVSVMLNLFQHPNPTPYHKRDPGSSPG